VDNNNNTNNNTNNDTNNNTDNDNSPFPSYQPNMAALILLVFPSHPMLSWSRGVGCGSGNALWTKE